MAKKKKGQGKGKGKDPFYKGAKVYGNANYDMSMDTGWGSGDLSHAGSTHGESYGLTSAGGGGIAASSSPPPKPKKGK